MSILDDGITAMRNGEHAKARQLLAQGLKEDPKNERGWMWMFNASINDTEKIFCLEKIVLLNPNNKKAQELHAQYQNKVKIPVLGEGMSDEEFTKKLRGWVNENQEWSEMDSYAQNISKRGKEKETISTLIDGQKKCPYCAELVQQDAKICKHCKKNIEPSVVQAEKINNLGKGIQALGCLLTMFVSVPACFCMAYLLFAK